jgi:hypothetical protein
MMPQHGTHSLQSARLPLLCLQAMIPEDLQFAFDQKAANAAAWLEESHTGTGHWQQRYITRNLPDPVALLLGLLVGLLFGLLLGLLLFKLAKKHLHERRPLKSAQLPALSLPCPSTLIYDDHG